MFDEFDRWPGKYKHGENVIGFIERKKKYIYIYVHTFWLELQEGYCR